MKNKYEICGETTKIYLRRKDGTAMVALIDTEDLNKVKSVNGTWYASLDKPTRTYYCKCDEYKGKRHRLHRLIMNENDSSVIIDHSDHNTLNNKKSNLRIATKTTNAQNMIKARKDNKTGFLGVCFSARRNAFRATIKAHGKQKHLGYFETAEAAYKTYVRAKQTMHPFNTLSEVV
jgi:hypothetical protein